MEPERISVSGLDALRAYRLLAFPECQFTTERVRFSSDQNEKNTLADAFSILVELRRIELLSEKTLIGLSPGAGNLLGSALRERRLSGYHVRELFSV